MHLNHEVILMVSLSSSVGSNPTVSALLPGIFSNRTLQPQHAFIWYVKRVIEFLTTLLYDNHLSLIDLTLKLTMLLALTSAASASEIRYLDTRYLIKHNSG